MSKFSSTCPKCNWVSSPKDTDAAAQQALRMHTNRKHGTTDPNRKKKGTAITDNGAFRFRRCPCCDFNLLKAEQTIDIIKRNG